MNTQDLKIFEAVAAHGNFTRAAEAMFTVQSNVTARIKSLEEEFGAELFIRTTRKVELSPAGETLMQYHKKIAYLLDEAKRNILNTGRVTGNLKIGCIETTMALKAPELIKQFRGRYPEVELEFKSALRNSLINDVLNYKLDAAFVSAPVNMPGLDQINVKEEQLIILTPAKYKRLQDVINNPPVEIVVFDQGCVFRSRLETWLNAKGITQYKTIVLNSIEGVINFVEAGLGISILPAEVITQYYPDRKIKTFPLSKELGTMATLLIFQKNVPPSPQLKAFIALYKKPGT